MSKREEGPERIEECYTGYLAVWHGKEWYGALVPMQSLWLTHGLDDDKIQNLLYETTQIEGPPIGLDMDGST